MTQAEIRWLSVNIMPYEPDVRRWIRRSRYSSGLEDDLIQEAYYRIVRTGRFMDVLAGRAYFFTVVKHLIVERLRRENLVRFEAMAEIESLFILDDAVSVDRELLAREELAIVTRIIDRLPPRCRDVFRLRRVGGLSQRETAERLGISENVVEKQTALALQLLLKSLADSADEHGYNPRQRRFRRQAGSRHDR